MVIALAFSTITVSFRVHAWNLAGNKLFLEIFRRMRMQNSGLKITCMSEKRKLYFRFGSVTIKEVGFVHIRHFACNEVLLQVIVCVVPIDVLLSPGLELMTKFCLIIKFANYFLHNQDGNCQLPPTVKSRYL